MGDIILHRSNLTDVAVHVQVVTGITNSSISIHQGNWGGSPRFSSNPRLGWLYYGGKISTGTYKYDSAIKSYSYTSTRGTSVQNAISSYNPSYRRWNFMSW